MKSYKETHTFEVRKKRVEEYREREPDKFILVAERHPLSKLPDLANPKCPARCRMLCPYSYKYSMVRDIIAKKITDRLNHKDAKTPNPMTSFFVFVGRNLPPPDATLNYIYEKYKDPDGILYVTYQEMESFGGTAHPSQTQPRG